MGKRLICLLLCLCLLLPAVGCGYQKDGELVCPLPGAVSSLDPQTASGTAARLVIGSLFEGLCRLDENGEAVPGVAERWECDSTQTEYTFHLRKNASWSDGTPVTADDFRFAIERCLNPDTASPNADDLFLIQGARAIYNGEADLSSLGVAAEDDRTLVIRLERASSDFPAMTAALHYMPCNRAYFQESQGHYGLSSQYLLTNGPFALASIYAWQTDPGEREITLVRSETYRGEERVLPATLTYQMDYDDAIDQEPVSALTQGLADVLVLSQEQARLAEEEGCQVLALEDAVTGLLLNPQAPGLESPALREIFLKTLDRQSLLDRRGLEDPEEAQGVMPECVVCGGPALLRRRRLDDPPAGRLGGQRPLPPFWTAWSWRRCPPSLCCAPTTRPPSTWPTACSSPGTRSWATPSTSSPCPCASSKARWPPATTKRPSTPCGQGGSPRTACSRPSRAPPPPLYWRTLPTTRPFTLSPSTSALTGAWNSSCWRSTSSTPCTGTGPTTV